MKELLERLEKVDINLWREIQGFRIHYERFGGPELTFCDDRLLDHIQGACQRAISSRRSSDFSHDWFWKIQYIDDNIYEATIYNRIESLTEMEGQSPAQAILSCYIKALEEQA